MLFAISVRAQANQVAKNLSTLDRKQIPFAASQAVNMLARQVVKDLQAAMQKDFDRPTPYTLKGFYAHGGTKKTMTAQVLAREHAGKGTPAWKYLTPEAFGGSRRMKRFERALGAKFGTEFTVPGKGASLDRFGNISEADINKLLSALKAFPESGYLANRSARSAWRKGRQRQDYFIAHSREDGRLLGVYRIVSSGHVVPVLIFSHRAPHYRVRLPYDKVAKASVEGHQKEFFDQALAHALATSH
jgi:hypothetical protein